MLKQSKVSIKPSSLLIRPYPFRNEGPKGYMLRLAEANFMPAKELQLMGIIYEPETLKLEGLLPLAEIDQALHENVARYSDYLFNQKRIWNHRYARFCPECLIEDAFWQVEWELLFHDACRIHGTWLIDQCSSCGNNISWNRDLIIRCQCGADLRAERANKSPESIVALSHLLSSKINPVSTELTFPPPFQHTNIEQTQRIIRYLGTYMDVTSGKNPLKIRQAGLMSQSWKVTSLASEICKNWPQAFYDSLDKIQREARADKPNISSVFGSTYLYLYKGLKGTAFNEIRAKFEIWFNSSWKPGISKRNKRLTTIIFENAAWISAKIACETLGISNQRLCYLIREGQIESETNISDKGRKFILVRRDNLETVKHNLSGEIDMKTAGALLGLNKKRVRQLLRLLFPNARKTGAAVSAPWTVPRFEINHLLSLAEDIQKVFVADEGSISLNHIFRYWAWSNDDLAKLINAVRTLELKPENVLEGLEGISGWIFNENVLKVWKVKSQQGLGAWLTITQTAKLIGIKEQVAYELVHMSLIKAETLHRQPKGGARIRRTEVDKFKENYIFATEIAHKLGVSPRKAISILQSRLITPVSGPLIDGARQVLYTRSEDITRFFNEIENTADTNLELC